MREYLEYAMMVLVMIFVMVAFGLAPMYLKAIVVLKIASWLGL